MMGIAPSDSPPATAGQARCDACSMLQTRLCIALWVGVAYASISGFLALHVACLRPSTLRSHQPTGSRLSALGCGAALAPGSPGPQTARMLAYGLALSPTNPGTGLWCGCCAGGWDGMGWDGPSPICVASPRCADAEVPRQMR